MRRWATAAGVLAAGVLLTACGTAAGDGPTVVVPGRPGEVAQVLPGDEAAERRVADPVSPADVVFIESMIPHHRQALELAALAPQRAADPQVAAIAARIAAVQGPEIAVMEAWLARQERYVGEHGGEHGGGHGGHGGPDGLMPGMATPAQVADLAAASGPAFDALFLQLMIAHHEGALGMADVVRVSGTDVRVAEIAQDVVVTQTVEIDRMRGLG